MKVLVLGVSGMLGNAVFKSFHEDSNYDVWGTLRSPHWLPYFSTEMHSKLIHGVDVLNQDTLLRVFELVRPDLVVNLIGITKQQPCGNDPLMVVPINALFPHRLAALCSLTQARLIHKSTDCVFSGKKGFYSELDPSDPIDLYGQSKYMGEISQLKHVVTIRTSAIGHELNSCYGLVDWFLAQKKSTSGYVNAIFSGLPANEIGRVIRDFVAPNDQLKGLYHIAARPINKYDLLKQIAIVYGKDIFVQPDLHLVLDRSLNAHKFAGATGYISPEWTELLTMMRNSRQTKWTY